MGRENRGWKAALLAVLFVVASAAYSFADDHDKTESGESKDAADALPVALADPAPRKQEQDRPITTYSRGPGRGGFIDFSRTEFNPFIGAVIYSGEFDADPDYSLGILARVPMSPFGGRLGLWAEGLISHIDRDLEVFQPDHDGNVFIGGGGFDFEVAHGEHVFLRLQAGGLYASFQNVNGAENGFGVVAGVQLGWHWIKYNKNISFTYNPQWAFDSEDWMLFHHIGFSIDF